MKKRKGWRYCIAPFASLKLAIFTMICLALLVAIGTVVESRYDANFAREQVYHRWWMFFLFILLAINLTAVMIHRWPWRPRHLGFLLAHLGILTLLAGSLWTYLWGIDGSLYLPIKSKNRYISLPEKEIIIYASFDGKAFTPFLREKIQFPKVGSLENLGVFQKKKSPLIKLSLGKDEISVVDYIPYALGKRTFKEANTNIQEKHSSPALLFQVKSKKIQQNNSQWLWQKWSALPAYKDLGPARILLSQSKPTKQDWQKWVQEKKKQALWFFPSSQNGNKPSIHYGVYTPTSPQVLKKGKLQVGDTFSPGWMDLKFQLLRYLPQAKESWDFVPVQGPLQGKAKAAIQINFRNTKHWLQLNQSLKLFTRSAVYLFSFGQKRLDLGYDLELKHFQVQYYPGSQQASEYQSRLKLPDGKEVLISMNQPWKHNGMTFYQASFQKDEQGRPLASILSVNYDPGRWWKYLGCAMTVLGILTMFYRKRKKSFRIQTKKAIPALSLFPFFFFFCFFFCCCFLLPNLALSSKTGPTFPSFAKAIGTLPLQEGGRIKPFDSFARESLMQIYGKQSYGGRPAHEVVFTWLLNPSLWNNKDFIRITHQQLKKDLGLSQKKKYVSIKDLEQNQQLPLLLEDLQARKDQGYKLRDYDRALSRLQSQMGRLAQVMNGQLAFLPLKENKAWLPLNHFNKEQRQAFSNLTQPFLEIIQLYVKREKLLISSTNSNPTPNSSSSSSSNLNSHSNPNSTSISTLSSNSNLSSTLISQKSLQVQLLQAQHKLKRKVKQFKEMARKIHPANYPSERKINWEIHYNYFRPFFWAALFYSLSLLLWGLSRLCKVVWNTTKPHPSLVPPLSYKIKIFAIITCIGAFLVHTYGFTLRSLLAERAPVSNIYETLVWVAWGAMFFAFILSFLRRFLPVLYAGTLVATLCLFVSNMAPTILDASIQPLEAVLRSNFWLFFHVLTITISYSALFIAFVLAEIGLFSYFISEKKSFSSKWLAYREQLLLALYRCIQIGVVLLATGIILGGIWADYSWGRFWGWDPKETWALITLLGYIAILHGRLAGWLKDFGMFMASSFAFFLVLMSWYGVNFILGTGLHSYGFGSGGVAYVFSFAGLHLFYAFAITLRQAYRA